MDNEKRIAIIGLGYVGLPLAVEFSKKNPVVGFDIDPGRVNELNSGTDSTLEVSDDLLQAALLRRTAQAEHKQGLLITTDKAKIKPCNYYIITVPTPVDKNNRPDLTPLIESSKSVGSVLKKDDIVIYESTVYPGVTEEVCIPVLEKTSGLTFNKDFFCGYSPERINPGDKKNTLTRIKKVTSGSTPEVAQKVDELYRSIIVAGTHMAPSMKIAEAAKIIENSQRDINIAFVNELAQIFKRLDIDTQDVLDAAATKWNFLKFYPGLVGGHCIGVDPYYLAQKAQEVGYHPQIILSGRRLNDGMGAYVASEVVKLMIKRSNIVKNSRVLLLGITFKENCPDIRNTRAIDAYHEFIEYGAIVDVYDPWADAKEVKEEFDIELCESPEEKNYNAIVLAVAHNEFKLLDIESLKANEKSIVFDVKGILDRNVVDGRL